jgi:hypothetical protein
MNADSRCLVMFDLASYMKENNRDDRDKSQTIKLGYPTARTGLATQDSEGVKTSHRGSLSYSIDSACVRGYIKYIVPNEQPTGTIERSDSRA